MVVTKIMAKDLFIYDESAFNKILKISPLIIDDGFTDKSKKIIEEG